MTTSFSLIIHLLFHLLHPHTHTNTHSHMHTKWFDLSTIPSECLSLSLSFSCLIATFDQTKSIQLFFSYLLALCVYTETENLEWTCELLYEFRRYGNKRIAIIAIMRLSKQEYGLWCMIPGCLFKNMRSYTLQLPTMHYIHTYTYTNISYRFIYTRNAHPFDDMILIIIINSYVENACYIIHYSMPPHFNMYTWIHEYICTAEIFYFIT